MGRIFCRGLTGHQPRQAVVFVNAGAIYHVGWARMHVDMARELARSPRVLPDHGILPGMPRRGIGQTGGNCPANGVARRN